MAVTAAAAMTLMILPRSPSARIAGKGDWGDGAFKAQGCFRATHKNCSGRDLLGWPWG